MILPRAILAAVCCCAVPASAHHSHAEFADELQVVEGELVSIAWRNPHPAMILEVSGDGAAERWHVQVLGNINGLRRTGVTGELFTVGERVAISGQVSRRRAGLLLATQVRFADGRVAILGPDESTGQAIYRAGAPPSTAGGAVATTNDRPRGIFRVWLVAERFRNPDLPLRPQARAVKEAWDSVTDDPQIGCRPLGMPGAMMSPHPIEFVRSGENIVLRLEEWDARRTIDMRPDTGGIDQEPGPMGYSTGVWEGSTLVVRTRNIDYPWMDEHGTPQSAAVEVVERFTLSADERSLDYAALVTDPGTMTEPVVAFTTRWEWIPGETLQSYDCAPVELPPVGSF